MHRGAAPRRGRAAARRPRAPRPCPARCGRWRSCWPPPTAGRRRTCRASRAWRSRTATSTPCSAGTPTPRCCAGGRFGYRGRRLLRPGGQLRRRARPLRRLGRGRRDRPAARGPRGRARPGTRGRRPGSGGATILADGFSCRTQLDQLADARAPTWPSSSPPASRKITARSDARRASVNSSRPNAPRRQSQAGETRLTREARTRSELPVTAVRDGPAAARRAQPRTAAAAWRFIRL